MEENFTKSVNSATINNVTIAVFCNDSATISRDFSNATIIFHSGDATFKTDSADVLLLFTCSNITESQRSKLKSSAKSPVLWVDRSFTEDVLTSVVNQLQKCIDLGFSLADYAQMYHCKISLDDIENHLNFLKRGCSKKELSRAATYNDGILKFNAESISHYVNFFENQAPSLQIEKFVPASGAASRMFGFLTKFIASFDPEADCLQNYIAANNESDLHNFISNIDKFPFYEQILEIVKKQYSDYDHFADSKKYFHFISIMLGGNHLNFAQKPKGVLPFHNTNGKPSTPVEAHLKEALNYANSNNKIRLHFTLTNQHQSMFEQIISAFTSVQKANLTVNFSCQEPATDTIALDENNCPVRINGQLYLRPSGHGALINNLNKLDSDLIFIKNIDNVTCNNIVEETTYKKALAGHLLTVQSKIFNYLESFDADAITQNTLHKAVKFAKEDLNIQLPSSFDAATSEQQKQLLANLLNRPIRVCGMVKNQGEPGGGPFWVNDGGEISLQIIETTQIDLQNPEQQKILQSATHFNPVDLVCAIKNYKKEKFNLPDFVDPNSGFIVHKNIDGRDIKAYELPGLWNGAMAKWITIFVEVPQSTFNPVKTVNDLLKPAHQPTI